MFHLKTPVIALKARLGGESANIFVPRRIRLSGGIGNCDIISDGKEGDFSGHDDRSYLE
jgi:hypothetical protein